MEPRGLAWIRRVGLCFPMTMSSMVILDQGGPLRDCTHTIHHIWAYNLPYIPGGFIAAGLAGALAVGMMSDWILTRGLFAQLSLSRCLVGLMVADDFLGDPIWLPSSVALGIAVLAHVACNLWTRRAGRPPRRAPRPTGNLYPTAEVFAP